MKIYLSKCWRQSYCVELGLIIFLVVFLVIFCIWSHDREDYIMILLVLFQILVLVGLLFASKRTVTYAIIEPDEIHSYSFFSKKLCTVVTTTKPVYYAIFKTPVEGTWRDQFIALSNEPFEYRDIYVYMRGMHRARFIMSYDMAKQVILPYNEQTILLLHTELWERVH